MHNSSAPLSRYSSNQTYRHEVTSPFYFAIENRWVDPSWDCNSPHWHDYFEIEIIYSGSGLHVYNESSITVSPGYVYLITPADVHSISNIPPANDLQLIHIRFDEHAVSEKVLQLLLQCNCCSPVKLDTAEYDRLLADVDEINRQCELKPKFYELSIRMMLSSICLTVLRNHQSPDKTSVFDVGHTAIQKTMLYIYSNFRKKITMQELGDLVHVSPNHLAVLFKRAIGMTCMQLISQLRMQHAVSLLRNTDFSIETIAVESGFASVSYFISCFHTQYNMSPREYRLKAAENNAHS